MESPKPLSLTSSEFYAHHLQTSLKLRDPFAGKAIHSLIIKAGLHLSVYLMNNLMNFYAKTGSVSDAHCVFDEMPVRTTFSWNTILSAYAKRGQFDVALRVFNEIPDRDSVSWTAMIVGYNHMGRFGSAIRMFVDMIWDRVPLTQFTVTNILSSCAAIEALGIGRNIHSFVVKFGLSSYVSVANSLLNMYAKSGDPVTAKVVFDGMRSKDILSWNAMISLHMQCGHFDHAVYQFEQMTERNIVSWNAIIAGYNQHGHDAEALVVFSNMLNDASLKPDTFTLASVLAACANLEKLEFGKQIHAHIIRNNYNTSIEVGNALISMYSKSARDINPARKIFDSLRNCDVIAWTAMIVGYVHNGLHNDALELFRSMIREGEVSLVSVSNGLITMYAKSGCISAAKRVFSLMQGNRYTVSWTSMIIALAQHGLGGEAIELFEKMLALCVKPDQITYVAHPSHYACMVDMFGRAGLLQEAFKFIETMPIEPDVIAWGSLLSSSKVHKNVDMAKIAADRLLLIEPDNSGAYTALANLYSAYSAQSPCIRAEDGLHPQKDAIYKMMEKIWKEIKKMGFVPDTESVLHDLEEEVWHFSLLILDALGVDLHKELDFNGIIANGNSKNYQL
ncbi:hypothetical protein FNV43_RR01186 [Rhamnella rubrinervis]|uniref:Pentatricopeptide repeat-containing protein n=1 Tax=Rhamnella rubrinervis TaxID=2594499 RepID=A0A8K0MSQ4_9ROSA|nr:hypothetical protein FNV43_RR01186 [Rhamnella rubrinervis]